MPVDQVRGHGFRQFYLAYVVVREYAELMRVQGIEGQLMADGVDKVVTIA